MLKFGKAVVKLRYIILAVAVALLVPSVFGYTHTRINYDILTYLPDDIETMKGQDILEDQFGTGALSMLVVDNKSTKEIKAVGDEIKEVPHVKDVISYSSIFGNTIPADILPDEVQKIFKQDKSSLLFITYDTTSSADETMDAVKQIRSKLDEDSWLQGMTPAVVDTKDLSEQEEPLYVLIAVVLALVVTIITLDNFIAPIFFLLSIGMAIIYNLGSNIFMGEISYITKALAAVLQLGVTMDYSIFLWHSYEENLTRFPQDHKNAMAHAIAATLQSVLGSSITTIAGFIALCFMSFTFGLDIGIVMAKGVCFGVLSCVTILPSMVLVFDKLLLKTKKRAILPRFRGLPNLIGNHYIALIALFAVLWIPAVYGYNHTNVYYKLDSSLPKTLQSVQANEKLKDTFDISTTHILLVDDDVSVNSVNKMIDEMKDVDGVKNVIGIRSLLDSGIPEDILPDDLRSAVDSGEYQLMLIPSKYETASDQVNAQIDQLNTILKKYDKSGMLIGDAPCTKDLITIADHDFGVVNWVSIILILVIVFFVFKSVSLPFLLVAVIEFAIFVNMAIAGFMHTPLPFVANIVIGVIQLGSTVDYAILMTSRYTVERAGGKSREESIRTAHSTSISSIIVSALSFFAATFGVGMYSKISIISTICILLARGAIISMLVVITILPAVLVLADPLIIRTTWNLRHVAGRDRRMKGKKDSAGPQADAQALPRNS